ncbi:MAG: MBL fold metallo-hydrolase [Caldilineaceae bacterium]|nr:MBL fold metallo-hydrolase [Caldilineaceae bacterium]
MAYTVQIGAIRCHILSDGLHYVDGGGFFGLVPRVMWQQVIEPNEANLVPCDSRALLIESDAGLILVDVGNGDKLAPKVRQRLGLQERNLRLVGELARAGYRPEAVDIVLFTHFHGDHIGGATRWDTEDGTPGPVVPTFPRARYIGQRLELADASFPNERTAATYPADNFRPLLERKMLEIVDGPQRLAAGVHTEITPGHTAAIQAVWVEDKGESLLFLTDAASWAVHLERLAWVPAFDILPMTSIETKRALRQAAAAREALVVFQHDPQVVAGRLVPGKQGVVVEPVITESAHFDASR